MPKNRVKTITGWLIITGHFGIVMLILFYLDKYLDAAQKMQIILTLSPVTVAYMVAVVKTFIAEQYELGPSPRVSLNYSVICLVIPTVLLLFLAYLIVMYPSNLANNVDSLQLWTAAAETFLGGAVGLIVDDLFPKASARASATT